MSDTPKTTYTDPVHENGLQVDDQKVTRTIPAGQIGNEIDIVTTTERLYSADLRRGHERDAHRSALRETTYQCPTSGSPPLPCSLPDPSFQLVQGHGSEEADIAAEGKQTPPPPPQD